MATTAPSTATPSGAEAMDLATATITARGLLAEIGRIWPGQAGSRVNDKDMLMSWGRAIAASGATQPALTAALMRLVSKSYPPDLGVLLAAAMPAELSNSEAEASLRRASNAAGETPPGFWRLNKVENWAARQFGGQELRETRASDSDVRRWRDLLIQASRLADLPEPPVKPRALIAQPRPPISPNRRQELMEMLNMMKRASTSH